MFRAVTADKSVPGNSSLAVLGGVSEFDAGNLRGRLIMVVCWCH